MTGDRIEDVIEDVRGAQDQLLACWAALGTLPGYPLETSLAVNVERLVAELAAERARVADAWDEGRTVGEITGAARWAAKWAGETIDTSDAYPNPYRAAP